MGKDRGDERRWHYRDPDTMRLGCDQGERDMNSGATSIPEHVTCGACLLHWRVMGRARAIEAFKSAPGIESVRCDEPIHLGSGYQEKTACGRLTSETSAGSTDIKDVTCEACKVAWEAARRTARGELHRAGEPGVAPLPIAAAYQRVKTNGADANKLGDDCQWLSEHGEDAASLRALVEAVDAAAAKAGALPVDSRAKYVNKMSSVLSECDAEISRLETRVCELEDDGGPDPDEETREDVPLGGMSHEDAHRVLAGIEAAESMLDHAKEWPDDARKVRRFLRELRK